MSPDLRHCLDTIARLAEADDDGRRATLQLGYNLGRVAELAGLGREQVWDRWKGPVDDGDRPALERLARELRAFVESRDDPAP